MMDSHVLNPDRVSYRQAGRDMGGKLVRGLIQDPATKTTSSSIPYKFETIIYRNENPKGFGTVSQRFTAHEDQAPGPGSYISDLNQSMRGSSVPVSLSQKGYGNGFASSSSRKLYDGPLKGGPGPGAYNIKDKPFQITKLDSTTSSFISTKTDTTVPIYKKDTPGPGYYNADKLNTTTREVKSVFASRSRRFSAKAEETPPPGNYEIPRSLLVKKPYKHYFGNASFMPPTQKKVSEKEHVNKLLGRSMDNPRPGPGTYFSGETDPRVAYKRSLDENKPFSAFAPSNLDRFGSVVQTYSDKPVIPGPGSYNVTKGETEKAIVSGAVFMSETMRQPFGKLAGGLGPTNYNPQLLPKKKSYHLNVKRGWV